jgi:hypothetical protein
VGIYINSSNFGVTDEERWVFHLGDPSNNRFTYTSKNELLIKTTNFNLSAIGTNN